jgi:hypothetical protein
VKATILPAPVTFLLSGRHHTISNSRATALEPYKLSVQLAPLCIQASSAPTGVSDYSLELQIWDSPKSVKNTACVSSSRSAFHRPDHVLLALVLAFMCALEACRPNQLGIRVLQLSEGKWSSGVEFGVQQREELAVAYFGQYELAGARPVAVHHRGSRVVKNRKGRGLFKIVSDTKQYCRLFKGFSNHQGPR